MARKAILLFPWSSSDLVTLATALVPAVPQREGQGWSSWK